ncbi:hypothetical protein [Sphingobacterium sp. xlx-130]|uniref:hypothetical protein n=1 Tax=Sphingobacterium sp. xlx-130 TaxID=2654323 RepID=UPI0013D9A5BC|nr:hypothetical protein [Sphingobacterium sp. xlx-130]
MNLPIYSMGEQPTCCPICGARTEWGYYDINKQKPTQHHICTDDSCQYSFLSIEEEAD